MTYYLDSPIGFFLFLWLVLVAAVHIAFALAVLRDAGRFDAPGASRMPRTRRELVLVGPWIWALGTLLGGVFAAAIYWTIHHSTLNPEVAGADTEAHDQKG
jgi:hypothetical protein